jgi:hypothetical protein
MVPDPVRVALLVAKILETAGIRYLIGGSLASTFQGEPRSTQDVDFVVHMRDHQVDPLIRALENSEFFFRSDAVRQARHGWRFFDLVHKKLFVKVDVYVRPEEGIHLEEMRRARKVQIGELPEDAVFLASPEDTVIQKLLWYRMGDGVSDRQWRDVVGVLKRRGPQMDDVYLDRWSRELEIADLMDRARVEAGLRRPDG